MNRFYPALIWVLVALVATACTRQSPLEPTRPLATSMPTRLGPSPTPTVPQARVVDLEIVTAKAATGDGGNAWGGHQCRIVRTADGVFTAYTVPGEDPLQREWRLAWRQASGWQVVTEGLAGREPVNLVAGPDGTLHLIAWPGGQAMMWSGKPANGTLQLQRELVFGLAAGNWPYASAGIDSDGNLVILSSMGEKPGFFFWIHRDSQDGTWTRQITPLPHRHCYTYVFPQGRGATLVSTRDVPWSALGYTQPPDTFGYVFNAFRLWHTADIDEPLQEIALVEEPPTERFPDVRCNAQTDAYLDSHGRVHILYTLRGASTNGQWQIRHLIVGPDGEQIHDGELPSAAGPYCRIWQDSQGRFFLLGSAGLLYPIGEDGITLGTPQRLDLGGHQVEYSGYSIAVPRTGTPLGSELDVVFPSDGGAKWVYFRLTWE